MPYGCRRPGRRSRFWPARPCPTTIADAGPWGETPRLNGPIALHARGCGWRRLVASRPQAGSWQVATMVPGIPPQDGADDEPGHVTTRQTLIGKDQPRSSLAHCRASYDLRMTACPPKGFARTSDALRSG